PSARRCGRTLPASEWPPINADKTPIAPPSQSAFSIGLVPKIRQIVLFVSIRVYPWPIHLASAISEKSGHADSWPRIHTNGHEWITRAGREDRPCGVHSR